MTQRSVEIETRDGTCPAALSIPDGEGPWPAILLFMDAGGLRDAMREMGERLSGLGYVVLVPDLYYRQGSYEPFDMRTVLQDEKARERLMGMVRSYTADMAASDAVAFADYLDSLPEKKPGGIGTTGYCMGGRLSLMAAGTLGARVAAAASFHGGGIANEADPDSPHHKADAIEATVYVGGATGDHSFPDEHKELLVKTLTTAGVAHTVETYAGAHGFAVPDNASYDEASAERHWKAMESLFGSVLGS